MKNRKNRSQRGYTLLEYCAGAAVLAGFIFIGMRSLGGSMNTFLTGVGTWVEARSTSLNNPQN